MSRAIGMFFLVGGHGRGPLSSVILKPHLQHIWESRQLKPLVRMNASESDPSCIRVSRVENAAALFYFFLQKLNI